MRSHDTARPARFTHKETTMTYTRFLRDVARTADERADETATQAAQAVARAHGFARRARAARLEREANG